jgi:hypothetical protein
MDHDIISGTGTYTNPTLTLIDAPIPNQYIDLRVRSSTNLLLKNASFSNPWNVYLYTYDSSNLTLENTTVAYLSMYDASNATLMDSTILSSLDLRTNGTIYLENTYVGTIVHGFSFQEGNIAGYNKTFTGASSWTFPKVNMGPNVTYYNYLYAYEILSHVNFTLTNTSKVQSLYAHNTANVTVFFLNTTFTVIYLYDDANITLYYSNFNQLNGYHYSNITMVNSTCNTMYLSQYAYARITAYSYIGTLTLRDSSWYYKSPDSTIDVIN